MKFQKTICQSCSAPILQEYDRGKEKDGAPSLSYCRRCFQFGAFTEPQMTAEKMRAAVMARMTGMKFPRSLAVQMADRVYLLKRWEPLRGFESPVAAH